MIRQNQQAGWVNIALAHRHGCIQANDLHRKLHQRQTHAWTAANLLCITTRHASVNCHCSSHAAVMPQLHLPVCSKNMQQVISCHCQSHAASHTMSLPISCSKSYHVTANLMQQLCQTLCIEGMQRPLSCSMHKKHAASTGGVMQSLCFVATGSRNSRYMMFLMLAAQTDMFRAQTGHKWCFTCYSLTGCRCATCSWPDDTINSSHC